jgi:hypothetical protein
VSTADLPDNPTTRGIPAAATDGVGVPAVVAAGAANADAGTADAVRTTRPANRADLRSCEHDLLPITIPPTYGYRAGGRAGESLGRDPTAEEEIRLAELRRERL